MKLEDGDIIPGKAISNITLGMSDEDLRKIIGENFSIFNADNSYIYTIENAKIRVDANTHKVIHITVFGDFSGLYANQIGIGSSLKELCKLGKYKEVNDGLIFFNIFEDIKGIIFEADDSDNNTDNNDFEIKGEDIIVSISVSDTTFDL